MAPVLPGLPDVFGGIQEQTVNFTVQILGGVI